MIMKLCRMLSGHITMILLSINYIHSIVHLLLYTHYRVYECVLSASSVRNVLHEKDVHTMGHDKESHVKEFASVNMNC